MMMYFTITQKEALTAPKRDMLQCVLLLLSAGDLVNNVLSLLSPKGFLIHRLITFI